MTTEDQKGAEKAPRVTADGQHILIPYGPDEGGKENWSSAMVWPNPANGELSYALRQHGELTRSQRVMAASILDAYRQLTIEPSLSQKDRNRRIKSIREALANQEPTHA